MLIGILADIHDAVEPLKASLVRFRELGVQQVVSLVLCDHGTGLSRRNQLWQIVYSKSGVRGGYNSVR